MLGWYIAVAHDEQAGDSTSWYSSFWDFCARYLQERYEDDYCISAEQSLMLHAGNIAVPKQLIIRSTKGNNTATPLLYGTSLFVMKSPLPDKAEIETYNGVRVVNLVSSLIHSTPTLFEREPVDTRTALMMLRDASELLAYLLEGGHTKIAGRLAGAYRNIGNDKIADDIIKTMKAAGYDVRESDPFKET
ncbi:MAG TPA: cell filamentation protein Fic, partial [Mangrovimonas sp.]|nr:cell filamentation protein Fic [Mangrovimonas sp.]